MKIKRSLAALLCASMLVTSLFVLPVSAADETSTTTKTKAEILGTMSALIGEEQFDSESLTSSDLTGRADSGKASLTTTNDGSTALKLIGHKPKYWGTDRLNDENKETEVSKINTKAVAYGKDSETIVRVVNVRFKIEGDAAVRIDLRNEAQLTISMSNGQIFKKGDSDGVTTASDGWHEILAVVDAKAQVKDSGGTVTTESTKETKFWYRGGDAEKYTYVGKENIEQKHTNIGQIVASAAHGATLYLDYVKTYGEPTSDITNSEAELIGDLNVERKELFSVLPAYDSKTTDVTTETEERIVRINDGQLQLINGKNNTTGNHTQFSLKNKFKFSKGKKIAFDVRFDEVSTTDLSNNSLEFGQLELNGGANRICMVFRASCAYLRGWTGSLSCTHEKGKTYHYLLELRGEGDTWNEKDYVYVWRRESTSDPYKFIGKLTGGGESGNAFGTSVASFSAFSAGNTLSFDNVKLYSDEESVVVEGDVMTKDEILGKNATVLNSVTFDAEAKKLVAVNSLYKTTLIGDRPGNFEILGTTFEENGVTLGSFDTNGNGHRLGLRWGQHTSYVKTENGEEKTVEYTALLTKNTAVEFSYTPPASNSNSTLLLQMPIESNTNYKRVYATIKPDGSVSYGDRGSWSETNLGTGAAEKTVLIVKKDDGDKLFWYTKNAEGKYECIGELGVHSGDYAEYPFALTYGKKDTHNEAAGNWKIHGVTRYALDGGVADSSTLPSEAESLREYVDEDFADLNEASYASKATSENSGSEGSVNAADNKLVIVNPTKDAIGESSLTANYASIPVGGYADLKFKMQGHLYIDVKDGAKALTIHLAQKDSLNETTEANTTSTVTDGTVNSKLTFEPNRWFELRIVRTASDKFTAYVKGVGETNWNVLFENAVAEANTGTAGFQIKTTNFWNPIESSNTTTKQYVKDLKIYGPDTLGDEKLLVLDGNQTTVAPANGGKLNYDAKIVVAPNTAGQLIFAGYDSENRLIDTNLVTVTESDGEQVFRPTLTKDGIKSVRVFLWNGEGLTPLTGMRNFVK